MPKVGGRRKKVRSHKEVDLLQQLDLPKTFIFKKGKCTQQIKDLTHDLRKCFYPNTAMKLQDTNKLAIKSYLKAAKNYHVNHLITLQHSKERDYIRFIQVGGGQMIFRILNFCRMKDVINNGGQPFSFSFKDPLLVLNGFSQTLQMKMIGKAIQGMFPPLSLEKAKTQKLKRVISFTYRGGKKFIYFRHYKIVQQEGGVSSAFQHLLKKPLVDLSQFHTLKQYLEAQSASNNNQVQGSQQQQKVKLVEMGPRLKLKFVSYTQGKGKVDNDEDYQQQGNQQQLQKPQKLNKNAKKNKNLKQNRQQNNTNNEQQQQQNNDPEEQEEAE